MDRRGFLRLTGQAAAVILAARALPVGTVVYDEPEIVVAQNRDWIVDRGSYYQVQIPDGKILAGESFDKPVLLLFGAHAAFRQCRILGFCNAYGPNGFLFEGAHIDARGMAATSERAPLNVLSGSRRGVIAGSYFDCGGHYVGPVVQRFVRH